ncbi:MAG: type VI secretion system tube protein TssD [Bacteroidota bacterium]
MALEAYLWFTSGATDTMKVLECDFEFSQEIDETGKPSGTPRGGLIHVTVESNDKTTIAEWMFAKMGFKSGVIEFSLRNNKKKELAFEDGACISYHESFNAVNNMPMILRFTISANSIKIGNAPPFTNLWKK